MDPRREQLKELTAKKRAEREQQDSFPGIDLGALDMSQLDPSKIGMAEGEQHVPLEEDDIFTVETALLHAISRNGFMRNPDRTYVQWQDLWEALKGIIGPFAVAEFCAENDVELPEVEDPLDFLEEQDEDAEAEAAPAPAPAASPPTPAPPTPAPANPAAKGGRRKRAAKKTAKKKTGAKAKGG